KTRYQHQPRAESCAATPATVRAWPIESALQSLRPMLTPLPDCDDGPKPVSPHRQPAIARARSHCRGRLFRSGCVAGGSFNQLSVQSSKTHSCLPIYKSLLKRRSEAGEPRSCKASQGACAYSIGGGVVVVTMY